MSDDPSKAIIAARLEQLPATKFISSRCADAPWHLGKLRKTYGPRTGLCLSAYYVTACSGRQLGGPWGQHEQTDKPAGDFCSRCEAIRKKTP
jgi:hypothetical protein